MRIATAGLMVFTAFVARAPSQALDTQHMPAALAALAPLVEQRCGTCHPMNRIVKARYEGDEWNDVVEKMRKKEKSGISAADVVKITAFLAAWSTRESPSVAPGRPGGADLGPGPAGSGRAHLPTHAAAWSSAIPVEAKLPQVFETSWATLRLDDVRHTDLANGTREAVASLQLPDGPRILTLVTAEGGEATSSPQSLRSWNIGPYRFRLDVVLEAMPPPPVAGAHPALTLALRVVRESP